MPQFLRTRLALLASLRFTVALLAIAMVLIFASTWALIDRGMAAVVAQYYRSFIVWIEFQIFLPRHWEVPGAIPWPGGYLLGGLLVLNLLAAHTVRFRITLKRCGILMIHAAVLLFLVGEAATAFFARESQMPMYEQETLHWSQDIQQVELAVVDHSESDKDQVTVVPQSRLINAARRGATIRDPEHLPFDIQIIRWIRNAKLVASRPMQEGNPATTGLGLHTTAESIPEASGVEGGGVNLPAAWVRLLHNGADLGTYLLSPSLQPNGEPYKLLEQNVFLEGRTLALSLRFRRFYHNYAITLEDFRHDKYTGSTVAKNFSSDVQVVDMKTGERRKAHIAMNEPLRYRGTTFYQSGYIPPDRGTVLQVMRNPGMPIPYIAFAMAACGLLYHFGWMLAGYARRQSRSESAVDALPAAGTAGFYFAWGGPTIALAIMVAHALPPTLDSPYDLQTYGAMPVSYKGRVKPMDTLARNMLLMLNGRQRLEHEGQAVPPIQWLADVLGNRPAAQQYRVFLVQHPELRTLLGMEDQDEKRLSFAEIQPHFSDLSRESERAERVPKRLRDSYDTKVLQLTNRLLLFLKLRSHDDLYLVPPGPEHDAWRTLQDVADAHDALDHDTIASYARVQQSYGRAETNNFNASVVEHASFLAQRAPGASARAKFETRFNAYAPFYLAQLLYLAVLMMTAASWFGWRKPLATAAYRVLAVTFLLHSAGLVTRIVLSGRPPVTNLYSSAVFIGWGCILFCLVLERVHRSGLLTLLGSAAGFLTLMVAAALAGDGDTMAVLVAVLDTNFWLATHVVIVTLGYSATFMAGMLGITYILGGLLTPWITAAVAKRLAQMLYGVIAFALVFSLVGTVLGGIWADQSWGRFWGWDPKENGALLIVLWNALILHARWGGLTRTRGIAAMAVFGNVVTSWSWFGTNMLGVGLHSYGFIDSALLWLGLFIASQMLVLAAAAVPTRRWRSAALRKPPDHTQHTASISSPKDTGPRPPLTDGTTRDPG